MPRYRRIRLGSQGSELKRCLEEGFAGLNYGLNEDLTGTFGSHWREFNQQYIPIWLDTHPDRSKTAAGLSCAALWTFCNELVEGDFILSPDAEGNFRVGSVAGSYFYGPGTALPHRRPIEWQNRTLHLTEFSDEFRRSTRGPLSNVDIDKYADEISILLDGGQPRAFSVANPDVEDPIVFALELHLEDFLVKNWAGTELGRNYDLLYQDGELVGQQYPTDTGPIDLLTVSKDGTELLVIELKKGRISDAVVGQIQRYMGYVLSELTEAHQTVRGVIIGLEDDLKLRRALSVTTNIDFYSYKVDFQLVKGLTG